MYTSTALVVLGLTALTQAHMRMATPIPFGGATLNNSPLHNSGSDYPCKQRVGVYDTTAIPGGTNTMPLGSSQVLSFTGQAVHGGGSCQLAVTYDTAPTNSSVWKVIHSIEGGCPQRNIAGNAGDNPNAPDPSTYNFTIPTTLPTGDAVLSWVWLNKIGNREIYMNCAPIKLTAAASKRDEEGELGAYNSTQLVRRDVTAYNALPNLFIINLPRETCNTTASTDFKYPDPGTSLELNNPTYGVPPFQGTCPNFVPGGGSAAVVPAASAASSVTSAAASQATSSVAAASATGGVFLGTLSSVASSATSVPVASSAVSVAPIVSSVTSVATVASSPVASVVASSASPSSTGIASTGTTGTGSAIAAGTACTTEGEWNCIGGSSFQRCASGAWSVVMELAAGTTCADGQSSAMSVSAIVASKEKRMQERRRGRFSGAHIRRHLQS